MYLLKLISEAKEGISGYALMKKIQERTGFWRPSPGSIYPLLGALEEEGLIEHRIEDDKKFYSLTNKGKEGLAQARTAREEALEGVRRSIRVLGELFGDDVATDLAEHLERVHGHLPPELWGLFHELRVVISELLSQNTSQEEINAIAETLRRTIEELRRYAKRN